MVHGCNFNTLEAEQGRITNSKPVLDMWGSRLTWLYQKETFGLTAEESHCSYTAGRKERELCCYSS